MRICILAVLTAGFPVFAQFSGLVTTTDGSQLYFSSKLRLKGSSESDSPKIFHYSSSFGLFREQVRDDSHPPDQSNPYILIEPQVSGDGRTIAYTSDRECYYWECQTGPHFQTSVTGESFTKSLPTFSGRGRLSADGRYLLLCCASDAGSGRIIDLTTGKNIGAPAPSLADGYMAIADDGIYVGVSPDSANSVTIFHRSPSAWDAGTPVPLSAQVILARISRDGSTLLYAGGLFASNGVGPDTYELIARNLATGLESVLASVTAPRTADSQPIFRLSNPNCCFSPWISDDGKVALYLAPGNEGGALEMFAQSTDGTHQRQIGDFPAGASAITLSGDGRVAYASTPTGELWRLDVETGTGTQLNGPMPLISALQPCPGEISCVLGKTSVAPGSVAWLLGSAFGADAEGASVSVDGVKAPVFVRSDGYLRFQIPWEIENGKRISIAAEASEPQPSESVMTMDSTPIAPAFLYLSYGPGPNDIGLTAAYHRDFKTAVTQSMPASPGEILHIYMVGLGPVSPVLVTGEPAPTTGQLNRIGNPIACSSSNGLTPPTQFTVPVKFAGAAPGLTGVYQVDIQVPPGLEGAFGLTCGVRDSFGKMHSDSATIP